MPNIDENDLIPQDVSMCSDCGENEGAIFLCGEGMICESCFAKAADIDEADAFVEPDAELRSQAKKGLTARREREGQAE